MLFLEELKPLLAGPRTGLRLFVKKNNQFRSIPVQVDPVDEEGRLKFFGDDGWRREPVHGWDLLSFRVEDFGDRIDFAKDQLPCRGPVTFQLRDKYGKSYAYLTHCGAAVGPQIFPFPVGFDERSHLIPSPQYRYRFNPENYMQFDTIGFSDPQGGYQVVAQDSRLMIRSDVKNFFTMDFDSDDIVSKLEAKRLGPVGNLARVSFYLKILFFKIDLSLNTNVGFYEDSGHIPMMVSTPVDGREWLNPKSGILYSWVLAPALAASPKVIEMPRLDPDAVEKGYQHIAKSGLSQCKGGQCYYKYTASVGGRQLSMDFGIEKKLVEQGFFPYYVHDVDALKDEMGWDIESKKGVKRVGMYFEVSGLPEGGHPWDFWLRLGGEKDTTRTCPHPVRFKKIRGGLLKGPVSK